MNWKDRWRAGVPHRPSRPVGDERLEVDRETGEILSGRDEPFDGAPSAEPDATAVQGERAIPSVNRERSIQSRVSSSLALGTIVLLGAGFLFWYYTAQYARTQDAEDATRKAAAARAAGEMKVPPLGRVDPPVARTMPDAAATAPLPLPSPAPVPATPGAAPAKTPEQLALERQLGVPVLRRAQTGPAAGAASPSPAGAFAASPPMSGLPIAAPGMAQWLGALQAPATAPAGSGNLAAMLKPTPTPAVSAQLLPTRRMLLPKGAFIDCTLETAIDSTFEGMTTCIGASDVYGADGKVVLLERGTKFVGEQRGEPRQGQGRVFVVWNEARTPTGVVVQLASPGTDELGRNGLPGFVDTHFWQRFGAAILLSVIDGTMQAITAHQQSGNNIGSGGGVVLGPQGGRDVIAEVLRNTMSIPPTVIKNQGERIQILVARDVDFRPVYALRSDPDRR
ncbi:type IV secretion system protein VirB10 [Variovorax sp. J22P240]|uniref:type IV secretion system protein VirB10 n=1 Tax=Variovorax sp. J22P240 TaxID=3053514 RepID=UPI002578477C|nr:type IV secretion system protein VirB10 [Variovorax sp. J22P240]MDM0001155.1 type IV secretion system protein VirB10 [Variovorax sp. J22P240]